MDAIVKEALDNLEKDLKENGNITKINYASDNSIFETSETVGKHRINFIEKIRQLLINKEITKEKANELTREFGKNLQNNFGVKNKLMESLLVKELKQKRLESIKDSDDLIVNEVKLLLENNHQEDKVILQSLGLDKNLAKVENKKDKIYSRIEKEKLYSQEMFSLDEIKSICIEYRLRFLPSAMYKGHLDTEVLSKIKDFAKRNHISLTKWKEDRFFIVAPAESFELTSRPKDPLLFFKTGDDLYCLVHIWGNDLSPWRLAKSFKKRSFFTFWLHSTIILTLLSTILFSLTKDGNMFWMILGSIFISIVVSFLLSLGALEILEFSEDNWNSPFKENS